ncbi:hypothetical protein D3C81_1185150 [compost metagenome]
MLPFKQLRQQVIHGNHPQRSLLSDSALCRRQAIRRDFNNTLQPAQPVGQRRQALMQHMRAALPCQAQAAPGPGQVSAPLAHGNGGDQDVGRCRCLQCTTHGIRQLQMQAATQQGFGPGIDHVTKHQHGVPRQQPTFGRSRRPTAEGHHVAPFDHLQLNPRVILHEQGTETPLVAFERIAGGHRQADHQHPQLKGYRRTQGDAQLRRTQHGQQPDTAAIAALQHQHAERTDALEPTCRHQQSLYQQLQGCPLRLRHLAQQALEHLLVDIVHCLIVNSRHEITSSTSCSQRVLNLVFKFQYVLCLPRRNSLQPN